ncbi:TRAP transporter small permease [Elioraea rosea]|uniref:TRAP transporter small permease n=1 Tax=Elioraea rosea TaxID=2492390 RepID=UPI001182F0F3|nr:TRAP transporter small permease [Elioraea rosea]
MGGAEAPRTGLLAAAARGLAIAGGLLLVAAMAVTVASVLRASFGRPILGDTEIVEMLVGVAIAWFMPWCQVRGAHVRLDVFTARAPRAVRTALDAAAGLLVALVVSVLAWRLVQGGLDAHDRARETMFLQIPFWWGYGAAALGMLLWAAAAIEGALAGFRRPSP